MLIIYIVSVIAVSVWLSFMINAYEIFDYTICVLIGLLSPITLPFLLVVMIIRYIHNKIDKYNLF